MAQRRIAEFLCSHRRTIQPLEGGHWAAGPFHPQQASRSFASGAQAPGRVNRSQHAAQGTAGFAGWRQQQHRRGSSRAGEQGMYLVALVISMQGDTVEAKLKAREENPDAALEAAAANCPLTISFNANVIDGMPWKFIPTQRTIKVMPGQSALAFYTAHNLSDKSVTGVSTYNVAPQQAGQYFNKIQCFCFEEQRLRPGEKIDMPVFFYVDPEFAQDAKMRGIRHLTLSYTFFQVQDDDAARQELQAHLNESREQLPPSMRGPHTTIGSGQSATAAAV
ncbi:hypothetical protein WJX84_007753 [Apatococcus fuscideae]|uniref:Uncharacterized protein n=1 Tax=Apatococcus fuscideae TaxID=2026836 RepID=A0AAW1TLH1_9CHLO